MKKNDDLLVMGAADASGSALCAALLGYRVTKLSARGGRRPGEGAIEFANGQTLPENHAEWIGEAGSAGVRVLAPEVARSASLAKRKVNGIAGNPAPNFDKIVERHWRTCARLYRALMRAAADADNGNGDGTIDPSNIEPAAVDLQSVRKLLAGWNGKPPEDVANALLVHVGNFDDAELKTFAASCESLVDTDPELSDIAGQAAHLAKLEISSRAVDPSLAPTGPKAVADSNTGLPERPHGTAVVDPQTPASMAAKPRRLPRNIDAASVRQMLQNLPQVASHVEPDPVEGGAAKGIAAYIDGMDAKQFGQFIAAARAVMDEMPDDGISQLARQAIAAAKVAMAKLPAMKRMAAKPKRNTTKIARQAAFRAYGNRAATGAMPPPYPPTTIAPMPAPVPTDDRVHPLLAPAVDMHRRRNQILQSLANAMAPQVADQLRAHVAQLDADSDEAEVGNAIMEMFDDTAAYDPEDAEVDSDGGAIGVGLSAASLDMFSRYASMPDGQRQQTMREALARMNNDTIASLETECQRQAASGHATTAAVAQQWLAIIADEKAKREGAKNG